MPEKLSEYSQVQTLAKKVLEEISSFLSSARTERQIAEQCVSLLAEEVVRETWYYEAPALVLLGSRSCLSISGRDYGPSDEVVGETNLVTIDLSPILDGYWGDCARSFFVEGGAVTFEPHISTPSRKWGFKHENIHYFDPDGTIRVL